MNRFTEPHDIEIVKHDELGRIWWCLTEDVNADECSDEERCNYDCVCNVKEE